MIHVLLRQILGSLRQRRLQSLFIFVTLVGAATAMSMAITLWQRAADPWEQQYRASSAPHVVLYGASAGTDFSTVPSLPAVAGTSQPIPTLSTRSLGDAGTRVSIAGVSADAPPITMPRIVDGRWLAASDTRGIVLDYAYARAFALDVGDSVDIPGEQGIERYTVVGLSVTLWRGPYPEIERPYVYVLPDTLDRIRGSEPALPILMIRLIDPESADDFAAEALSALPAGSVCCASTWKSVRRDIASINGINLGLLSVFAAFTLLAAGFVIANTISGRVIERGRNIALLKAIGETPAQVTLSIVLEHLLLAGPAALIGFLSGIWASRVFLWRGADPYATSPAVSGYWGWFLPFIAVYLGVVALFSLIPAWRGAHAETTQALRPARIATVTAPSWTGRLAARLCLPVVVRYGLKDLFVRPSRSVLMGLSVTMIVALIMIAIGAERTLATYRNGEIWASNPPELTVRRSLLGPGETRQLLAGASGIETTYEASVVHATFRDGAPPYPVRVVSGDIASLGLRIVEGRMFADPGEMIAAQGLLDATGLDIGDEVMAVIDSQTIPLRIVGRYVEFEDRGEWGMVDLATFEPYVPVSEPDTFYLQVTPGTSPGVVRAELTAAGNGMIVVEEVEPDASKRDIFEIRVAIYSITAIVALIGVINIVTTSLLDLRERQREIGVLKALGMTIREITTAALLRTLTLALIGASIGVAAGSIIGPRIYDRYAIEDGLGAGLAVHATFIQTVLVIPATLLFAALSAVVPVVLAARTPPAEALRYE